jgi:hypothetical protein
MHSLSQQYGTKTSEYFSLGLERHNFIRFFKCCGPGFNVVLGTKSSLRTRFRIQIANPDPDPEGQMTQKKKKVIEKISFLEVLDVSF